jgi:hypothetical protein
LLIVTFIEDVKTKFPGLYSLVLFYWIGYGMIDSAPMFNLNNPNNTHFGEPKGPASTISSIGSILGVLMFGVFADR